MDGPSPLPPRAIWHSFVNRLRPVGLVQEATFAGRYSPAYAAVADHLQHTFNLPYEIIDLIFEAADHVVWTEIPGTRVYKYSSFFRPIIRPLVRASTPPADGSCPFLDKLPAEVRRQIFVDELDILPSRNRPIYPVCGENNGGPSHRHQRPNPLVDLMLLNKKIRDEVSEAVYEERTFAIHVHPGFQDAGIEFLHVGRQPLQYLDHIGDGRFTKFRTGEMFGFCRLKKIEIRIFPDDGTYQHSAINTYFMNIALVRLLTRNSDKDHDRITSIRVVFPPTSKPTDFDSWWDTTKDRPRQTSIHGISDVELVLRPFALLTHVHQVDVQLPEHVDRHVRSVNFVQSLVRCMTATTVQGTFNSDALEMKIESARFALEDHIRKKLYGSGRSIHIPKITGEELEEDKQSQDSEDEDNDDVMDTTLEDDPSEDQHESDMDEDQSPHASQNTAGYAMFDEDGGFPDDLDSLHEDIDVAPDALSEKVARFVECFSVTGDVARRYLDRSGDDLERACQLFLDISDLENAVASKRRRRAFGHSPMTPSEHNEPSDPNGGSDGPSGSGDVDQKRKGKGKGKGKGKNKKGKQRATPNDDDDDNVYKNVRWDDDSDDEDDDDDEDYDPNGSLSNNRFHALRTGQTSRQQDFDGALWQPYNPGNLHLSELREGRRRLNPRATSFLRSETHDRHVSSSTYAAVVENERGRPTERNPSRLANDDTTTGSNNSRGVARPSRTIARRDSSTGLAANYSEDGQWVSEYRRYESPGATTSSQQMAEERLLYHASIVDTFQDPTQHSSNSNYSTTSLHRPGEHIEFASSSEPSNAFGDLQSQSNTSTNSYASFNDYLQNTHWEYRDLPPPLNPYVYNPSGPTPFSRRNPVYNPSNMQQSDAAQSSRTAQANAQWAGENYYPGGDYNSFAPHAGPYLHLGFTGGLTDEDWVRTMMGASAADAQSASDLLPDVDEQSTTQPSHQSSAPNTSANIAPSSLQQSDLTSNVEGMDVDTAADPLLGEAPVNTKQKRGGDF